MSFILDALKKSEHERQRQAIPGLVEAATARPRRRLPFWAIALGALLAINLIVLLVVLARGWLAASPRPMPISAHRDAGPVGMEDTAAAKPFSPLDAAPVYAPEVPVTPGVAAAPEPAPSPAPAPAPAIRQPATSASSGAHPIRRRDPLLNGGDTKADDEETLPSLNELNLAGVQSLPELHLDVHVFAANSAERFVFINMRKYHEGAVLAEGPSVERIRRDGVILNYQGLRFLLPRQ